MSANQWPFDMSALERGSFVSREQIAAALPDRARPGTEDWSLTVMEMVSLIEAEFRRRDPMRPVTLKSSRAGIRILTDREASKENMRRAAARRRGLRRDLRKALAVDVTLLPPDEREAHDRHVLTEGRKIQSARREERAVKQELGHRKPPLGITSSAQKEE